jgi:hypothetical protein
MGFLVQLVHDSWPVGSKRTDYPPCYGGRGLDDRFASVRCTCPGVATRQRGLERPNFSLKLPVLSCASQHCLAISSGLDQGLEAHTDATALEPARDRGNLLRCAGGDERNDASSEDARFRPGPRTCFAGLSNRRQIDRRSRCRLSLENHFKDARSGTPPALHLTGSRGRAGRNFEILLDFSSDVAPAAARPAEATPKPIAMHTTEAPVRSSVKIERDRQAGPASKTIYVGPADIDQSVNVNASNALHNDATEPQKATIPGGSCYRVHLDRIPQHNPV